jgi:hypothetical protein
MGAGISIGEGAKVLAQCGRDKTVATCGVFTHNSRVRASDKGRFSA